MLSRCDVDGVRFDVDKVHFDADEVHFDVDEVRFDAKKEENKPIHLHSHAGVDKIKIMYEEAGDGRIAKVKKDNWIEMTQLISSVH